ncbi:flagellar motor protein MotB [Sphingobium sp. OAS761]|uniref:flagellar motor protein MotB n=1 Tax=Sphingobium sp. OAS761 TaxID=2817901 RepID=UPI0020A1A636|nr:flagellar motor protein MotB [Sphingobium sp. OAS761]MCP1471564.1 flagellar motor protein MotB [Sphingobium sp. OAS761]
MSAAASGAGRRHRWAVSFADLLLLLLGFFILLQASGARRASMLSGLAGQFGGRPMAAGVDVRAADLFVSGEALLTPGGRARIAAIARHFAAEPGLEIRSHGSDPAHQRFDEWDLAAARLGAVARTLRADGMAGDRLRIRGLDQGEAGAEQGQHILIAPAPAGTKLAE